MKLLVTMLMFFIPCISLCAEKAQKLTYVVDGIAFNEKDDISINKDKLNKLIVKRNLSQKVNCCDRSMTIKDFSSHIAKTHSTNEHYYCPSCSFNNINSNSVKNHFLKDHVSLKIYTCPKCSESLKSHETLKVHFERCMTGVLQNKGSNHIKKIRAIINKTLAQKVSQYAQNFSVNFSNLESLIYGIKMKKTGRYYHCPEINCKNSATNAEAVTNCSLKHIDNNIFTCPNCCIAKDSYEQLTTHYKTCSTNDCQTTEEESSDESMASEQPSTILPVEHVLDMCHNPQIGSSHLFIKTGENKDSQESMVIEQPHTIKPSEITLHNYYQIPQYGSGALHPSDVVMQRVSDNILNAPFGREDKMPTDREKLIMALTARQANAKK